MNEYREINPATYFDSPERSSNEEVLSEILKFKQNSLLIQVLEGFPEVAVILNKQRQIVAFNSKALSIFNTNDFMSILGKRVGEAINCIHHAEMEGGCGTSQFCKECGAAKAIKQTIDSKVESIEECRITSISNNDETSLELKVHTTSVDINEKTYTLFAIKDISNQKRREALERIFFHDVLNTAGVVNGLAQILPEIDDIEEREELTTALRDSAKQLISEIIAQRELHHAEDGKLEPNFSSVSIKEMILNVYEFYKNHELVNGQIVDADFQEIEIYLNTDPTLLIRSLGNLFKNALEASHKGDNIRIYSSADESSVSFHVYNDRVIPKNVQLQLFQRSFSTKQRTGRGIGLYSVKLIVEQYLKGKVTFVSDEEQRTIFTITIPKNLSVI